MSNSKITKRVLGASAAVALSAGIGLATAAPAHADVWDSVAQCESGGNWGINTGNGFHGGLQFTQSTWNANGGSGSPENASKSQQKQVAQSVLRTQGAGAWPVCGARAGLNSSNGSTGSYSSGSSSSNYSSNHSSSNNYSSNRSSSNGYSSNRSSSNGYSSNHSSYGSGSSNASSNYTSNSSSGSSYGSTSSTSYTPRHSTGTYTAAPTYQLPKHAYKGNGKHTTIKSGDTLAKIATKNNVKGGWMALWSINHNKIANPDVILAGSSIEL